MNVQSKYKDSVQYLYDQLPVFQHIGASAYKPGLDNTIKLLESLNNPHTSFKSIHVAGTNGKGSVSHFLAAIFQSAGYKTGLYTSPHLVDFGERIRVNGEKISQDYVIDFVENHKSLFDSIKPSFFEATMSMAFKYFADEKVDIAIVEVGMGGRLDSTNIINPLISVITNISFDHTAFLGDTYEKIAFEKAGIIKDKTPVVIGEWQQETFPVFENKASETNSKLYLPKSDLKFKSFQFGKMIVEAENNKIYKLGLSGKYQLKNAATVLTVIKVFNELASVHKSLKVISEKELENGLENVTEITSLKGRWQILSDNPRIIADTGHNEAGIRYVREQLKAESYNKLHIIFGMVNDKDIIPVLKLLPENAQYYFTQAAISRALPANILQDKAKSFNLKGSVYNSVNKAIEAAIKESGEEDLIFIGGSNFIVGEALEYFENTIMP